MPSPLAGMVTQCQGFGRYAVPCKRRVKVGKGGYAYCKDHVGQALLSKPLSLAEVRDPRARPGHLCRPVMLRPETYVEPKSMPGLSPWL
jgi:hypothetical protein